MKRKFIFALRFYFFIGEKSIQLWLFLVVVQHLTKDLSDSVWKNLDVTRGCSDVKILEYLKNRIQHVH